MTEDRDFKDIVRERAARTGESYQAARRRIRGSSHSFTARVDVLFRMPAGVVLGCTVESGSLSRGMAVTVVREEKVVHRGTVASLRRFKTELEVVSEGQFGVLLDPPYEGLRPDRISG